MELRDYALAIVARPDLESKLAPPAEAITDETPGPPLRLLEPARSERLAPAEARKARVPPLIGYSDPHQRARILSALANHELQAAELFAWALLAFPDTEPAFRRGLLAILHEEQKHCRLYLERLSALGHELGDFPLTAHFWNRVPDIETPLHFVCAMGLTFENANLDFAGEYAAEARRCGDHRTAEILDLVHAEEIRHVAFAYRWLGKLGDSRDLWGTYEAHLEPPLSPGRARGKTFDRDSRERAGMDDDFIDRLETATAVRPSGRPR